LLLLALYYTFHFNLAESIWLHLDLIKHMLHVCSQLFNGGTALASANVSTYPSGAISYLLASASTVDFYFGVDKVFTHFRPPI
jgi:spermidine synthase